MSGRICKYSCGTQLGEFDTSENKYRELDNTLHTKERCQELKSKKQVDDWAHSKPTNGHSDISLEVVLRKLESIGVTLDLNKLRNAVQNGDSKQ